jgi:ATP-dependent DNA helicase RecG
MNQSDFIELLDQFRNLPAETEWLEFKEAKTSFEFDKLGMYFSALSNEANLKGKEYGWLIFGIRDFDRAIVGTNFRQDRRSLDKLKGEVSEHTTSRIGFVDIHELKLSEGRVVMFQIPRAVRGIPTEWRGHCYGRDGDNTIALSSEKRERIRNQFVEVDWSSAICPDATIEDLDPDAIAKARANYKAKFGSKSIDIDSWSDAVFLNKAKVTIQGKITRAAIILLGKEESEHFVDPADIKIRWVLKDTKGVEKDWKIEGCPFLLAVDRVYGRIRNLRYRYIKDGTLFPDEVDRYEPYIIREALHNCIAHQDYTLRGRINVIEGEDHLIFTNLGSFIPGSVEKVINDDAPEEKYRNKFLANAMVNLNMVDTIGSGIRKMFIYQRERFFPLPEYDFSNNRVKVTVIGKVLDMDFASVLARDESLTLEEIMMLDKVQKRKTITKQEAAHLRTKKLIEGIKPNYFISANLAQKTGQKATYTKTRGFEKDKCFDYVTNFLRQHGDATRRDFDELLWDVLPDRMSDKQKKTRINHLLTELSSKKRIKNVGSKRPSRWILINDNKEE